jgi:hypothetical protein
MKKRETASELGDKNRGRSPYYSEDNKTTETG